MRTKWYVQIHVSRPIPSGRQVRTCLVEMRQDIKVGNCIAFKDDHVLVFWNIETVSLPIPVGSVDRTWSNNI